MDDFPSSPSSAWSCTHSQSSSSANQDHLSLLTPDSYFFPAPSIVSPDEFTLQIDAQLNNVIESPHKSSITHLLSQPSLPPLKADSCSPSGDDMSKVQMLLRNTGRWGNMYDRLESSPPLRPHDASRFLPSSHNGACDDFSDVAHSALVDPSQPPDPSRCSLLIHEVSLLVGLTAGDDCPSPDDGCPLLPNTSKQVHDTLPLCLTPTKSLASRKHRNAGLPCSPDTNVPVHSSNISISRNISPHADNASPNLDNQGYPPVGPRDPAMPIPRHKSAGAVRRSLSPRRRQGQVFLLEPFLGNAPQQNAVDLDDMFSHPREPPPKPTPKLPANRRSSLDRLEHSLLKLEAHAPGSHRKSRSEGRPSNYVAQRRDKRPSLPPPRLKQRQSCHEISPTYGHHLSAVTLPPSVPGLVPLHRYVVPRICPAVPSDEDPLEMDPTPGSFMDMDIPLAEPQSKRRQSYRQVKSKEKAKDLFSIAKRVSRGVIAWGKNLTGSTKPSVPENQMTTVTTQNVRV